MVFTRNAYRSDSNRLRPTAQIPENIKRLGTVDIIEKPKIYYILISPLGFLVFIINGAIVLMRVRLVFQLV